MTIASQLVVLFMLLGTGCAEDMPVTARYIPADCPKFQFDVSRRDVDLPQPLPEPTIAPEPDEDPRVDLNTATQAQLEALPGVGPALARRIIEYRTKRRFERIAHLRRVRGIGPATFRKLRELVTVQNENP